jgi:hypothetical protein
MRWEMERRKKRVGRTKEKKEVANGKQSESRKSTAHEGRRGVYECIFGNRMTASVQSS